MAVVLVEGVFVVKVVVVQCTSVVVVVVVVVVVIVVSEVVVHTYIHELYFNTNFIVARKAKCLRVT